MTINIYPAYQLGKEISHADDWDDESTLNLAYANFWYLVKELKLDSVILEIPGKIKVNTLEVALSTNSYTKYTEKLRKICAIARIKRAPFIAFS